MEKCWSCNSRLQVEWCTEQTKNCATKWIKTDLQLLHRHLQPVFSCHRWPKELAPSFQFVSSRGQPSTLLDVIAIISNPIFLPPQLHTKSWADSTNSHAAPTMAMQSERPLLSTRTCKKQTRCVPCDHKFYLSTPHPFSKSFLENMLDDCNSTLLYVVTWSPSASSRSLTYIDSTPCRYTRASLVSRPLNTSLNFHFLRKKPKFMCCPHRVLLRQTQSHFLQVLPAP